MTRKAAIMLALLTAILAAAIALRLVVGPEGFDPPRDSVEWALRWDRILIAITVGSALSASGVMLQSLLRNPLAAPAILGLTSGAGFGVTLASFLGFTSAAALGAISATAAAAVLGSIGALAMVYLLAQRRGLIEPISLILVGVVVSLIFGAGIVLLQHLMPDRGLVSTTRWLLGSIRDDAPTSLVWTVLIFTFAAVSAGAWLGPAMDAAALGDDEAQSVGVRIHRLRLILLALSGALTAGSVILAGPIGFVGLICPHAVRLLMGPTNRWVMIGSALLGASLIVAADAMIRVIDLGAGRMPIGVLTALLGGPAFLWLLRSRWIRA